MHIAIGCLGGSLGLVHHSSLRINQAILGIGQGVRHALTQLGDAATGIMRGRSQQGLSIRITSFRSDISLSFCAEVNSLI